MYFSPLARSRDFSDCFVVILDSFYFLNSLQSNNNCNIVYILWHKYVWALFKAHFNPRLAARAKTTMFRTQNIFTPANVNSIVLVHYNPTCDFSIEALCLSIIGLISIPSMSRSLSPWEKLSSSSWADYTVQSNRCTTWAKCDSFSSYNELRGRRRRIKEWIGKLEE